MKLNYFKNGKLISLKIPKNNNVLPKTKRLRKKKLWLHCADCGHWFRRYYKSYGTRNDGKKVCHSCLMSRYKKARPDLFQ
ncbi:hypothetical protein [Metabacillus fastidiosus]|uniref:Zinc-ribbon domain-containing protein n=1 Tax=Metabacillus fastidiosus TaxID=1458 RepID=A0ABU6NS38_9BACI|nr:hypothetical protein [Metabacillus fastidiosus]